MVGIPRTPCPKKTSARGSRLVKGPLGAQYHTPLQRNNARNRKNKPVMIPGTHARLDSLRLEIQALKLAATEEVVRPPTALNDDEWEEVPVDEPMDIPVNPIEPAAEDSGHLPGSADVTPRKRNKREEALRLSIAWEDLVPRLIEPFLDYVSRSTGMPTPPALLDRISTSCVAGTCSSVAVTVLCLHWDRT